MNDLILTNGDRVNSLEMLRQINIFRLQEDGRSELQHKDLLKIIRNEFEEEINEGKISCVNYTDKKGEARPMFELTLSQAKQVLVRESKFVRKAVIHRLEELEKQLNNPLTKFKNMDKWDIVIMYAEMEKAKEKALLEAKQKQDVIDTAARSLMGIECEDSRKNINMLVKSLVAEYCNCHGIKTSVGNSEAYSTIYRDFCRCYNINYNLVAKGRVKYNKKTGEPLKTKKSIIEVLEEMNQTDNLLKYINEVKIEDIK